MPRVEQVSIFLASPGDVLVERNHAERVIEELNRTIASSGGMSLKIIRWEEDVHPGYGKDAQAIINDQVAKMSQCDLFVGVMWNRVGTPTPRAESGTVEEFEIAAQAFDRHGKPEIWFYFRNAAAHLDTGEQIEQRKQVVAFKEKIKKNSLPWSYKTPKEFQDKFRVHLSKWLEERTPQEAVPAARRSELVRVNGYKLFYFRANHKLSFASLARLTGLQPALLRKLEKVKQEKGALKESSFNVCERNALDRLEEALACRGTLLAGKADDFLTQYMQFYYIYKTAKPGPVRGDQPPPLAFKTRAVVFDFDGTLTRSDDDRTTWEKIWVMLGYSIKDCADLHLRFQRKEFSHQIWCDRTRDKFRVKALTTEQLKSIAREIHLVDGVRETVETLRKEGVNLFILSGSIRSIIQEILGDLRTEFEEIKANEVLFDAQGIISQIQGTPYDFEGKATFLKRLIEDWQLSPMDVLFVGNSCNDVFASQSGVRTLCVNPKFTDPANEEHWTYAIREMVNLKEVMDFIEL